MAAGSRGKETIMNPETLELKEKRGRQVNKALRFIVIMLGVSFLLAALCLGWNCLRNPGVHGLHLASDMLSVLFFLITGSYCIFGGKSLA